MLSSDEDWKFVRHYFGAELDQSNFGDFEAQYRFIRVMVIWIIANFN